MLQCTSMEEKNHTKRRVGVFAILIVLFAILLFVTLSTKTVSTQNTATFETPTEVSKQCYIWNTEAGDSATLILSIKDTNVEGSFTFLPAEKDSKRGILTGTLSALSGDSGTRTVYGWWSVLAEGMNSKEEILITLSGKTAAVGFGEMKQKDDGSFVYVDVTKLSYQPVLQETSCDDPAIR
ncbi:MAG: hypothetical protein QG674_186 [Patescibacteria group bacterium]|nr:hypothetical protein [Patescibacteria group bacterium]